MPSDKTSLSIGTILGELITASGIVSGSIVEEAQVHAKECSMPVGRVLVMSGHLGEGDLNSALRAAKMVKEGKLTRRQATQALREAYHQCIPFEQALDEILEYFPATKLGLLLIKADIVSDTTLAKLEERTREGGILGNTLGQALTAHGIISAALLTKAIELLTLTRESRITLDQAAEALRACCAAKLPADVALRKVTGEPIRENQLARIGALLTAAEIASREDILLAAEISAEANRPIGEILIELGIIDEYVLQATLTVQGMIAVGSLTENQGLEILHQVRCHRVPVEQVLDELRVLKKRIVELLKFATIIDERHIQKAIELHPSFAHDIARALMAANLVDLATVKNAVRCLALMQSEGIKEDIAAAALRHSQRTGMPIETAICAASALDGPVSVSQAGMKVVDTVHQHFAPAPVPMPQHFDATPPSIPQVPMSA
jgi:hypothetical protein